MKDVIEIIIQGGMVQEINAPEDLQIPIIVKDYDIEGVDDVSELKEDENGHEYIESEW